MKRYVYLLLLAVSFAGLNSCSKSSDPAPDPLVGTWKLDRIRSSGFSGAYASYNGDNDPTLFDYQDTFTTKTDKTFTGTVRTGGRITDYNGNWTSSSNTLTLNDSQGNTDTYTLDQTKSPLQLLGQALSQSDSLTNPSTKKVELVNYTLQLVYVKQ